MTPTAPDRSPDHHPTDETIPRPADDAPVPAPVPPKPIVEKSRWPYPLIWLVPILAAIAAGSYYYFDHKDRTARWRIKPQCRCMRGAARKNFCGSRVTTLDQALTKCQMI